VSWTGLGLEAQAGLSLEEQRWLADEDELTVCARRKMRQRVGRILGEIERLALPPVEALTRWIWRSRQRPVKAIRAKACAA